VRQVYRWYRGGNGVFRRDVSSCDFYGGKYDKVMPLEELFKVIETVVDVRFVMDEIIR